MLSSKNSGIPSSQNRGDTDILERVLDKPKLAIVEEPKDRGMRFRYECEGRSAGSILGASSTHTEKTLPTIEVGVFVSEGEFTRPQRQLDTFNHS